MRSSHGATHTESAKVEKIKTEFFAKTLQIILESRSPYVSSRNFSGEQVLSSPSSSCSSSSSVRPRDKRFNLALTECPTVLENLDVWRQSNLEQLVVDVVLVKRPLDRDAFRCSPIREIVRAPDCTSDQEELGFEGKSEKIIERWVLQCEGKKSRGSSAPSRRSSNPLHAWYKKSILLMRSLYLTVRLLPAYTIFRDLNLSGQIRPFSIAHRVSTFVEPFTRKQEGEMQQFGFSPVDTPCGRLCVSVLYRSSVSDVSSELATPMSPQLIPDYVGSPLAEPLKRLTSLPACHNSPPFSRRHSWSDRYKASPLFCYSPSPTHSEPPAETSDRNYRHFGPLKMISFSRSSSRSFLDFHEAEFPCPFEVEYDDVPNPDSRHDSYVQFESGGSYPIKKSQDAVVGALVSMLRNAPPLCQDLPPSADSSQGLKPKVWDGGQISAPPATAAQHAASSCTVSSKTTADALEELRGYKELVKDLLLNQASRSGASTKTCWL